MPSVSCLPSFMTLKAKFTSLLNGKKQLFALCMMIDNGPACKERGRCRPYKRVIAGYPVVPATVAGASGLMASMGAGVTVSPPSRINWRSTKGRMPPCRK